MGLRLLAHYYDRSEALVVQSVLNAAGVLSFVENYNLVAMKPFSELALGGFRLMVCEADVDDAVAVIREARSNPLLEGECLSTRYWPWAFFAVHLLQWWFVGFFCVWIPIRWHHWRVGAADG